MAMSLSAATEVASGKLELGELKDAGEANVFIVQLMSYRLIEGPIPGDIRKALYAAVKQGELGHIPKDGLLPEAFHHKNARGRALEARERAKRGALEAQLKARKSILC